MCCGCTARVNLDNVGVVHTRRARCRYGESLGDPQLRDLIAEKLYGSTGIKGGDIIVSDGSKCDIGRVQMMFGEGISVAVQVRFALTLDTSVVLRPHARESRCIWTAHRVYSNRP